MAYDSDLVNRVREYLNELKYLKIEEKKMFGGLAFMINDKMCINIGEDQLMCRFHPDLTELVLQKNGFKLMIMNDKEYKATAVWILSATSAKRILNFG